MTAHRGQRPRRADPVDGDLGHRKASLIAGTRASFCAGSAVLGCIRRLRKPCVSWGAWAGRDDGSSGPLGVAAPGRHLCV